MYDVYCECFTSLLAGLQKEMNSMFVNFQRYQDPFCLTEDPWVISTKDISELSISGPQVKCLKD
jgi:hypothetical protein